MWGVFAVCIEGGLAAGQHSPGPPRYPALVRGGVEPGWTRVQQQAGKWGVRVLQHGKGIPSRLAIE